MASRTLRCTFVPPWLLERLGHDVEADDELRRQRERLALVRTTAPPAPEPVAPEPADWTVHSAGGSTRLPGSPVRGVGDAPSGDVAVDEASESIVATLDMWEQGLGRSSFDGAGAAVSITVHYGRDYDNAFWDGRQLVFGDGDGEIFERFTKPVDVLAHEFGHAVIDHTAGLVYRGQSGALNESVSDAFAACLKQRLLGQDAAAGDWLVGEGLFKPEVAARALRDMARPGTAFDDPRLGADPQVGHMDDYVETTGDNGGVHLNSGIPNRAFQVAAVSIGGDSLAGAGAIWYDALIGGVSPTTDFAGFASATVTAAGEHAGAVADAWEQVGVTPSTEPVGPEPSGVLRVTRTGGFAGLTVSATLDLASDATLRALVARARLGVASGGSASPDRFVYTFQLGEAPAVELAEQDLTTDQREIAHHVLGEGAGPE